MQSPPSSPRPPPLWRPGWRRRAAAGRVGVVGIGLYPIVTLEKQLLTMIKLWNLV
jgi:hypothetical protein